MFDDQAHSAKAMKQAQAGRMRSGVPIVAPRRRGLADMIRGMGDNAASALYGANKDQLRGNVWGDVLAGIGAGFKGGDVLAPGRQRGMDYQPQMDLMTMQARMKALEEQALRRTQERLDPHAYKAARRAAKGL